MGGVVPEQMVGPTARLAERVRVGAPEEVRLHVHLLDGVVTGPDPLVHPLMARVEAAGVATHRDEAGLLLHRHHRLAVGQVVAQRDLDLDVLAGAHRGDALFGVERGGRGEYDGIDGVDRQHVGQVGRGVLDAVLVGERPGPVEFATRRRRRPPRRRCSAWRRCAWRRTRRRRRARPRRSSPLLQDRRFSRIRLPTAVLLAGTW